LNMIVEEPVYDPGENLRREYLYWKTLEDPSARVWRNEACIVLGRFLNAEEETYLEKASAAGVPILWRPSGGGAVFHDMGNLNYSIYLQEEALGLRAEESLRSLSFPVTELLDTLRVPWEWVPPNNIYVRGRKISGSAQARSGGRLLHHGTLLVDCDLDMMARVLKPGGRSRMAPVINLKEVEPGMAADKAVAVLSKIIVRDEVERRQSAA
jgi:lipoate-protein ligase A